MNPACDPRTTCTNTIGSYNCSSCPAGYIGDSRLVVSNSTLLVMNSQAGGCQDLNECQVGGYCDPVANCTNTNGSFICGACRSGYTGTGISGCTGRIDKRKKLMS